MRNLCKVSTLVLLFVICAGVAFVPAAAAQNIGEIQSMKLLTESTGWVATKDKLFWTTDNGANWKDITPKLSHKNQNISSVFFVNANAGWVLLKCSDSLDPKVDDVCFEFASTNDGGQNWSITKPRIFDPVVNPKSIEHGAGFSGATFLHFTDAQHGWAIIKKMTHVQSSSGIMMRTVDGGRTWEQLGPGKLPIADKFEFITSSDGWVAGGGQPETDLYVTHDAGNTWEQVSIEPPSEVKLATQYWPPEKTNVWPSYSLPSIDSSGFGYLTATYTDGESNAVLLFSTADLGHSWKFERTLPVLYGLTNFFHQTYIVASLSQEQDRLALERILLKGRNSQPMPTAADIHNTPIRQKDLGGGYDDLSFFDDIHAWLLADKLLSTSDGGKSWKDITPGGLPSEIYPQVPVKRDGTKAPQNRPKNSTEPSSSLKSMHWGFDSYSVLCNPTVPCTASRSESFMQSWMSWSPFYDYWVYLPGSPNRHTDNNLNSQWVASVQKQGWGLSAIWFGLQSTCVIDNTGISRFIGPTMADATAQGKQQALNAIASAANTLQLSTIAFYDDIENYDTSNLNCSLLVEAYISSWDSTLQGSSYVAGIYANPDSVGDIMLTNPLPNDLWTANSAQPYEATIWNQGITDLTWTNQQRARQFRVQRNVSFAGSLGAVDYDMEDSDMAPGNGNGVKTAPSVGYDVSCPGGTTIANGVNDIYNGDFINTAPSTPTQIGSIVGTYTSASGVISGFIETAGTCTYINYSGAINTYGTGLNNVGQAVGYWEDSAQAIHGWIQQPNGTLQTLHQGRLACSRIGARARR